MELSLSTVFALLVCGYLAGGLGALVGIGGGVVLVPALVLIFGVDIRLAVAASLVSVVATSTASGSVWVGKGLANMRLGMTLEVATTLGGISGGLLAASIAPSALSGIFAVMMVVTAALMLRGRDQYKAPTGKVPEPIADEGSEPVGHEEMGKLAGSYFDAHAGVLLHYRVERLPLGSAISFCAGILSGLLGLGGGFIKVPAMHLGMHVPIKVAAATSNFMIGVTAISSLFVYFELGFVHPFIATPVALGVVFGALSGTVVAKKASPKLLRQVLSVVLLVVAVQMGLQAMGKSFGR